MSGKLTTRINESKKEPEDRTDLCVLLDVDTSGSMNGKRMAVAKATMVKLAEVFDRCNIPFYIMGDASGVGGYDANITHIKNFNDKIL